MLAPEILRLPPQHVAEQHRRLVVEIVAGREDVVAVTQRGFVEDVTLRQSAGRTRRALRGAGPTFDVEAVLGLEVDFDQLPPSAGGEGTRVHRRVLGVRADAEPDVQTVGLVAEVAQQLPQPERVLASRDGHQDSVAGLDHVEMIDRAPDLLSAVAEEARAAIPGVVAAHLDDGRLATTTALHLAPPDMTGLISTTSSSCRCSSCVASVSLRMTITDSGTMSSSRSKRPTFRGAATSISRLGFRRTTLTRRRSPAGYRHHRTATVPAARSLPLRTGNHFEHVAHFDRRAVEHLFFVARDAVKYPQASRDDSDQQPRRRSRDSLAQPVRREAAKKREVHVRSGGSRGPSGASCPSACRARTRRRRS